MNYKITPYVNKVFDADILSYLNVDSEGDVVSAKTWKALWGNILNFTQQIDIHMTELLSPNGVITTLVADHERIIEEHALILADYNILKQKFAVLDDVIARADANVYQALQAAQIAHDAALALGAEFIHYGDTPPTNPYTKLWARKTDATSLPASLADVMMRVPKVSNGDLGAPYSSVLAVNNYDPASDGTFPSDSAYKYIGVHDVDYHGKHVESAYNYAGKIPTRGAGGNLWTGTPIDDADCVPKKYVDDGFVKQVNGNFSTDQAYVVDYFGQQTVIDIEDNVMYATGSHNFPYCIPRRNRNGNLYTNGPIEDLDCVNKKYVDDAVANAGGGGNVDLSDYVKNTDYATDDTAGIVKVSRSNGLTVDSRGQLMTDSAGRAEIAAKKNYRNPIMPSNLDYAVKVGITTNTETLTDEEKAQAQSWLGITDLVGDIDSLLTELHNYAQALIGGNS